MKAIGLEDKARFGVPGYDLKSFQADRGVLPVSQTLDQLPEGQSATILDVDGDDAVAMRLLEMGLTDGEMIRALGAAPLGDPLEFEVRGYRLSLRIVEARRVLISNS